MKKPRLPANRLALVVALGLLAGLLACSGSPTTLPTVTSQPDDVAALKQQVAAQETRIAVLEAQAALAKLAAAQATRIAALETQAALPQPGAAQAQPTTDALNTPQPTPTMLPAVAGLATDGNTKGDAGAKVTITEYVDYL